MPFFRNAVYIIKEKTFLKVTSVIFRLFTNLLRICMYIYIQVINPGYSGNPFYAVKMDPR